MCVRMDDCHRQGSNGSFELPLPATYVIAADGIIRYVFVNSDDPKRAEPADVVAACRNLQTDGTEQLSH